MRRPFQYLQIQSHLQIQNSLQLGLVDWSSVSRELPHFYTGIQHMSKVKLTSHSTDLHYKVM